MRLICVKNEKRNILIPARLDTIRKIRSDLPVRCQSVEGGQSEACPPSSQRDAIGDQDGGHVASRLCPPYALIVIASTVRRAD